MKMSRSWMTTLCLVGLGAVLILPSLGIGIGSLFTFLLILACPLMHLFMMRGHGGHGSHDHGASADKSVPPGVRASLPAGEKKGLDG